MLKVFRLILLLSINDSRQVLGLLLNSCLISLPFLSIYISYDKPEMKI